MALRGVQIYKDWNKCSNLDTIGTFEKICTTRFVLWAIQCCLIHVMRMLFLSLKCHSNVASLKKKTPFPPKQMSFSPNSFLVNLPCYIRDCVMERVRLSTLPPRNVKRIGPLISMLASHTRGLKSITICYK
jgi:hypothetical protein